MNEILAQNQHRVMPMERREKLKAIAILSKRHELSDEEIKDRLLLTMVFSFSEAEAVLAVSELLKHQGKNPDDYKTPVMLISREIASVVEVEPQVALPLEEAIEDAMLAQRIVGPGEFLPIPKSQNKSLESLIDGVRYVFALGNKYQQGIAEAVIKDFEAKHK